MSYWRIWDILNRETLLSLYDRFSRLVEKLPGGLQKPILRELGPIREVFLEQRAPRFLLLGAAGRSVPEFFFLSLTQWQKVDRTLNTSNLTPETWGADLVDMGLTPQPPELDMGLMDTSNRGGGGRF